MKIIEILSIREELISEKGLLNHEILPFGVKKQLYNLFIIKINPYYIDYETFKKNLLSKYSIKDEKQSEIYHKEMEKYLNTNVKFNLKFPNLDNFEIEGFYPMLFSLIES